ncbi:MAG: PBECR2 nuclease fold domain-containing protein [Halioglobus sp.]
MPKGIGPGWAYNVGKADSGRLVAKEAMDQWRTDGGKWVREIQTGFAEAGRPAKIPLTRPPAKLGPTLTTTDEMTAALKSELGGESKTYQVGGLSFSADAEAIAEHIAKGGDFRRTEYFPLLDDAMSKPYETWLNFETHPVTGKVRMVARMIKGYDIGRGRALLIVTEASRQYLRSYTMLTTTDAKYVNAQRQGKLLYAEDEDEN